MLPVITWDDMAHLMATDKQYRSLKDPKFKETWLEFLLATVVVKRTLGEDWWQAAADEVASLSKGGRRGTPMTHPLSPFLAAVLSKKVTPALAGQVINLAIDFLTLLDLPEANQSLEEKVPELRSKTPQSFFETWFEIRMASTCIKKGMRSRLLQPSAKEKRPDIEVIGPDGRVFVECKVRARLSTEERTSAVIYRKKMRVRVSGVKDLILMASDQLQRLESPTLIAVNVDLPKTPDGDFELKELRSTMELAEIRRPHVNGILLVADRVATNPATEVVQWGQDLHLQMNITNPERPNPSEFFRVLMDSTITTRPPTLMLSKYAMAH